METSMMKQYHLLYSISLILYDSKASSVTMAF